MQGKRNKTIISRITENRNFGLLLGLAVLLIIAAIVTPSMYSLNSILSMLQNNAVFGLLALGEMVVIITAGIDICLLPESCAADLWLKIRRFQQLYG